VTSEIAHTESFNVSQEDTREKEKRKFCLQEIEEEKKRKNFSQHIIIVIKNKHI
jgi:hypothetical protein